MTRDGTDFGLRADSALDPPSGQKAGRLGGYRDLLPLALLVAGLSLEAHLLAGRLAVPILGGHRVAFMLAMAAMYAAIYLAVLVLNSIPEVHSHMNSANGQVRLAALWRSVGSNPLPGIVIVLLTGYGATASTNLAEIYRFGATGWHDSFLWRLEYPMFASLHDSWLDWPWFWDQIYFQMWSFVLAAAVFAYRRGGPRSGAVFGAAIVLAFYFTRCINLAFPTAGPAFFQPHWFHLDGTMSQTMQTVLQQYTAKGMPADGVDIPTMAMPSLHVGLTAMAAWFMARERRWTLWLSVPWLLLVWAATVVLGWHYVLDGVAGMAVAGVAVVLASRLQGGWDRYGAERDGRSALPVRLPLSWRSAISWSLPWHFWKSRGG